MSSYTTTPCFTVIISFYGTIPTYKCFLNKKIDFEDAQKLTINHHVKILIETISPFRNVPLPDIKFDMICRYIVGVSTLKQYVFEP